eukprot:CAMPEP_0198220776 /NCGR_PEP_ID=MMETSP1445-20131203/80645_1 /TAXON_ID=36898 /ORGANISM="Pyramimonas sp., Strain CCMP2087" /LENGTH=124 /DNA_ID=CAMNT_0043898671 /DNA_START=103 /DNA_END=474 /DNA_ORIENTATION=+
MIAPCVWRQRAGSGRIPGVPAGATLVIACLSLESLAEFARSADSDWPAAPTSGWPYGRATWANESDEDSSSSIYSPNLLLVIGLPAAGMLCLWIVCFGVIVYKRRTMRGHQNDERQQQQQRQQQ